MLQMKFKNKATALEIGIEMLLLKLWVPNLPYRLTSTNRELTKCKDQASARCPKAVLAKRDSKIFKNN